MKQWRQKQRTIIYMLIEREGIAQMERRRARARAREGEGGRERGRREWTEYQPN